jgi:hypothetical protein
MEKQIQWFPLVRETLYLPLILASLYLSPVPLAWNSFSTRDTTLIWGILSRCNVTPGFKNSMSILLEYDIRSTLGGVILLCGLWFGVRQSSINNDKSTLTKNLEALLKFSDLQLAKRGKMHTYLPVPVNEKRKLNTYNSNYWLTIAYL